MPTPAPRRLSLRRNFSWILVGSVVANGSKWAMFVLLAKLVSANEVGTFTLALAVATPITILAQLQLRAALITDAKNEYPFGAYRAMRLATVGLALIIIGAVGLALYGFSYTTALLALVGLSQVTSSLRDIWMGLSQKQEQMNVTATGNMIDGVLSLAFFGTALALTRSVLWAVLGMSVARLLTLWFYDMPRARATMDPGMSAELCWHVPTQVSLFWKVLPLGLTTALVSFNSNVPQYFIEEWVGRDQLAYFAAIMYFVLAARLVVTSLSRAASPRLARLYSDGKKRRFTALLIKLVVIAVVVGGFSLAAFALVGETFLRVFYNEDYAAHADLLIIIMLAGCIRFVTIFVGTAMTAARFFKIQPFLYVALLLATLIACWLLIPQWGLTGAAWALVAVSAVNLLLVTAVVLYIIRRMPTASGS